MKKLAVGIAAIIALIETSAVASAQSTESQSTDGSLHRVQALEVSNAALAKENAALRERIKLSEENAKLRDRVSRLGGSKQEAPVQQNSDMTSSALTRVHPDAVLYDEASSPMAVKAPLPASAPTFSWTGFYAGLNIGGGSGNASDTFTLIDVGLPPFPMGSDSNHITGVIGGGQAGYNWQIGQYVLGIETDIQGTDQTGSAITSCSALVCAPGGIITNTEKLTWFGTTRGRVGVAFGNWLTYVTGGAAYGREESNWTALFPPLLSFSNSTTRSGWTVGGGVEASLVGNWTWKVEYLYIDLGTATFTAGNLPGAFFAAGTTLTETVHFTDNILRAGVNLRF
ncbi:MAG: outer membrane protein [Xanthobacteraceae bacterium]